jgi:hypothetical protein
MFSRRQRSGTMQTAMWRMTFALCGVILCVHFSAIQLANMPLSPLKLRLANVLDAYVNPYFTQRWNFFAPQPINYDVSLIARARVASAVVADVLCCALLMAHIETGAPADSQDRERRPRFTRNASLEDLLVVREKARGRLRSWSARPSWRPDNGFEEACVLLVSRLALNAFRAQMLRVSLPVGDLQISFISTTPE